MIRLVGVLLVLIWTLAGCCAAAVQSQRYQVKSVTTDGLNRMTLALFQLDFDAALGVDGTALADLSQNETSDVVLNMFGTDVPLPQSTAALLGVATLRCDGQTFDSAASAGRLNETQLIPVAANADPILGFFNALRVPGASNFYVDMPASSRSLAVLLILQDTRECDPWFGCSRDTGLARRLPDTDFSRCSLSVGRAPDGTYLHAVAEPSTPIQLAGVTDFDATPLGDCILPDLTAATANFEAAALAISGTSFDGLQASFWRAIMFGIADPIVACTQLLDELLTDIVYNGTAATDLCLEDGVGHTDDPCCSARLRYGDGCCAARPQNFSFPSAQLNPRPRRLLRETGCKHHRIVLDALNDYLQSLNNNLHPNTGCSASARQLASPQLFAEYFGFVDTCWDILRNNPPTCSRNEDCIYSGVCFSLECQPAYNSGYGGLAHTQCFADHMHPTIAAVTKVSLGMPDATRDEFVAAMQAQLWNDYCNSYWYSDYPPLWFTVPDSNALFGRIFNTDIDEETCLNWSFECTYDSFYSEDECFALAAGRDGMCSQDLGDYSAIATTFAQCTYSGISDPDTCAYFGGEWDLSKWDPCYLPGLDDEQSCLDTSVCPPPNAHDSGYWIKSRCSANWCLRRDLDQASCTADCGALQWQQTADGNGICIDRLGDSCDVGGLGEWWVGRTFYSEMYGTEEECTAGICGGGGYIYFGTDGRNCTGSGSTCTQRCSMCSSASEGRVLCTQPNATDSCLCFAAGGTWVESLNACRQPVGRTACAANGWNLWECSDLPDEQTCSSCTTPECQYLECTWQPYDLPCRSEAQCNAYGGRCGEKYDLVNTEGECDINNPYRPARCFQGCLYPPFFYDPEGFAYCPLGYQTAAGCIYQDVNSSTIGDLCTSLNGTMVTAAINEQQCQAYGQHCYEAEFAPFPTGKNETQCDGCLGNWQQSFKWSDGVWAPYARLPLVWNKVAFDPSLWWQPMMNYTKLEATVVTAAVARTRLSLQSEAQCLMNPLHSLLQLLACECTDVNRTEARDECGEGKVRSIDIGSTLLCAGSSSSVRLGGFTFVVGPDSVPSELGCVIVDATSLPAVQFAVPQQQSLSSLSLAQAGSTAVDNDYAVLDNRYGRQIGQLVSNVMNITLTPLSSSAGKRIDPAANQSIVLSNLTVCFDWLTDIVLERAAFPVQDLAWYSGGKFHPLDLQLVSWQASPNWQGRLMFCTTTNFSSGSFTPVLRVADYHQKEQVFTSVELAFIYIVAVLFLIAFVVALVLTLLTLYVHGFKGFCVNLFKGKQLAILILTLLLLFTGIRGIWLILSATETINGQSSLALDAVLTDLPIYIFFTLFMLLIFFWADLYHFQFKRKNSVLGRMKIPFILVNVFIYVFFFVIIIVYSQSDASAQPTVGLVYKCIVAGIGFSILTSFAIYGGLLMYKSFHSARATGGANNDQFIRMSVITLTCSIASFVQFIFLLLFAFTSIDNVVSILVYLFVVEVIPAYLLIYIFFHPKRLNETLTTSYGSQSSRKVRSLPGSKRFSRDGSRRSGSALSSRSSVPLQNVGNSNSASASN